MIRFIVILIVLLSKNLFACTIFSVNQDEKHVLVGNNCDTSDKNYKYYHIEPGSKLKYGAIYFGSYGDRQSGINEHGLFYADASIPNWSQEQYTQKGIIFEGDIRKKMLQECITIEDAIKLLKKYNTPLFAKIHMLIADKTGKSVIVEWDGNKLNIIPKKEHYQIATNFILSNIQDNECIFCWRYKKAKTFLNNDISLKNCVYALSWTHQKQTLYSIVADLKNNMIYLFLDHDYDNVIKLNIIEELKKEASTVQLDSFFENNHR